MSERMPKNVTPTVKLARSDLGAFVPELHQDERFMHGMREIHESKHDQTPYNMLADHLQEQGDPLWHVFARAHTFYKSPAYRRAMGYSTDDHPASAVLSESDDPRHVWVELMARSFRHEGKTKKFLSVGVYAKHPDGGAYVEAPVTRDEAKQIIAVHHARLKPEQVRTVRDRNVEDMTNAVNSGRGEFSDEDARLARSDYTEPTSGPLARVIARSPNFQRMVEEGHAERADGDMRSSIYQTPVRDGTQLQVVRYKSNHPDRLNQTFPTLRVVSGHASGYPALVHVAPVSPQEALEAIHQHSGPEEAKKFLTAWRGRGATPTEVPAPVAATPEAGPPLKLARAAPRSSRSDHWIDPTNVVHTLAKAASASPNDQVIHDALSDELQARGDPLHHVVRRTPAFNQWWDQSLRTDTDPNGQGHSHAGYIFRHPNVGGYTTKQPQLTIHHVVIGPAKGRFSKLSVRLTGPDTHAHFVAPVTKAELAEILAYHKAAREEKPPWPSASDSYGRRVAKRAITSPAVGDHPVTQLARVDAVQDVTSRQQSIRRALAGRVMAEAGLTLLNANDVMTTGPNARASLVQQVGHDAEPDAVNYAAAWYGMLAKEPHLTVFHESPGGKSTLHVWKSPLGPDHVIDAATRMGLPGVAVGRDGTSYAFDPDSTRISAIRQLQGLTRATDAAAHRGTASNLGSSASAPSGARAHYREAIAAYERQADPGPSPARP